MNGIGVSRGVAIGKVHLLQRGQPELFEYRISSKGIETEVKRFRRALEKATQQLRDIRDKIPDATPQDVAAFIDTHLLMLKDTLLSEAPIEIIRERRCNAEWALKIQRDALVAVFDEMEDPYLRTRRDDVVHVIHRIQRILLKQDGHEHETSQTLRGHIVVADELTPADTVMLEHERVAGFVTEFGGPLSHTAILARSLGIPAIVGLHEARRLLCDEERIVIDGGAGMVVAGADVRTLRHFRQRQQEFRERRRELDSLKKLPARTLDKQDISLLVNIELPEDIRALKQLGISGVGLYRTEFLFLNRDRPPTEEEHLKDYRRVIRALQGKPLTIRTMDLGGDKECAGDHAGPLTPNPALGLRAIRRCLKDTNLFMPQLRAILRASAYGPVRLMFPMLTSIAELDQALRLVEQARQSLKRQNLRFDPDMPVGGMIETPAAALSAELFAQNLDFLSIGTNDLIQYTLAIDRIDEEVNYLYDPLHPAVLKLIYMVLKAGRKANIPVSMCGEMAGDPRYTRLLLGLGLREFSAQPAALLEVKRVINTSIAEDLIKPSRRVLKLQSGERALTLLKKLNRGLRLNSH